MTEALRIDLPADQRRLVLQILRANLPPAVKVWVFGSRATGRARRYSDLDLAIDAGRPLTLDETASLADAFSESDLTCRVDVVDWHAIDDRFQRIIEKERVPLAEGVTERGLRWRTLPGGRRRWS
jgi:predicted nucleotidyltransferase